MGTIDAESDTAEVKLDHRPYDFLYKEGVTAYLDNNWEECMKLFEEAVQDWHWWENNLIRCRKICSKESNETELLSSKMTDDDRYYERVVRNTHCVIRCKKDVFGSRVDRVVERNVIDDFHIRKPYDYLQLCYYKLGKVKEAADAATTVLAAQPDNEVMLSNLQFYTTELKIQPEDVVNLELKEYGKEYVLATHTYDKADYKATITHMEKSLALYYEAYEDCRFLCENPFNQGWFPDFISSIANHFTFTLRCKRRCTWELSNLYGEIDDEFFSSYFNYLQYSYHQQGDMKKACEAVASYLVMSPEDEVQNRNKQYYMAQQSATEDMFVPREDVVSFKEREDYEEKLLDFIETNFAFLETDEDEGEIKTSTESGSTNTSAVGEGLDITTLKLASDVDKAEL
ncbi:hypothetical protein Pcinc_030286 [Petrolisthes cinctipes]|uniref:Leprecan-like alpha-helical domain-containing protein n=1 Tax=Petrolisthes cinctipes TaxID=88211 RepID=A0AAE1EZ41_PETCI|nr:hypothetical protein Pcinc_030286 [Petrolisthes cinctipes]